MNDQETDDESDRPPARIDLVATLREAGLDRTRIALWVVTGLILVSLWTFVWGFVGTLILGLFVYYVTRPLFDRIHARVHSRTLAVVISLVTVALPVLFVVGWTLVIAIQAISDFLGSEPSDQLTALLEPYVDVSASLRDAEQAVRQIAADPSQLGQGELGATVTEVLDAVLASLGVLGVVGLQAFIVLVITFYLLRDDYRIAAWARGTFVPVGSVVEAYLVRVDRDLKNVFFGNILNALVTGLIAVVSYLALNAIAPEVVRIPQPALVGLLVGVASLVPAIGIKLVTFPLGLYLLARSALMDPGTLWFPVVFFAVSFVIVDYIPDQLLRPYVSGRTLHVGAVMLAYLFGPLLFGWYGIFLGPFLLVVVFEFGRIVVPWLFHPEAESLPHLDSDVLSPEADEASEEGPHPDESEPAVDAPPSSDAASEVVDGSDVDRPRTGGDERA